MGSSSSSSSSSSSLSSSSSSSSSSLSSRQTKYYQVFLSFRGEDTRHNFTSHLLKALKDNGIGVFFDEEKIEKGEELSPALLRAIAVSKISIVILSEDYASSKSCLTELAEIMECKRSRGHIAVPIFYHVDPSDVRKHGGSFRKSFDEHTRNRPEDAKRWKAAFTEVGQLKGWHIVGHFSDRSEPEYIKLIVGDVIAKLNSKSMIIPFEDLVGIEDQKKKVISLLRIEEEETCVLGICGMGGIGKTTLAETVYNEVSTHFDDHCFLLNVREKIEKHGVEPLRNELLSKILKQEIHIDTPFIGSALIRDRLQNKRVLVVLDDVNDSEQIDRLGAKYFGAGSKIIVTSRDKQVLENAVDLIYDVKKLNEDDSLHLFSKFAFKQHHPNGDFCDLSDRFVEYAGGIPLALKVLGPALYRKPREYWESALDKLKEYPNPKIFNILKISFDGLDRLEKNIFLDIACFFKGRNKDDVTKMLKGCYRGAYFGIINLMDKCLVNVSMMNTFWMHDLLQEMGWDIVRQESKFPGKRSRLWSPEDVYRVLKYNKGTEFIEGISLNMSQISGMLELSPSVFEKMDNLRVIQFYYSLDGEKESKLLLLNQDIKSLPDELRYLEWDYCPLKSLPSNFNAENLVELKLSYCNMEQLWDGDQINLVNLKVVDLKHCDNLTRISNLSQAKNIEKLTIGGCNSLVQLPCLHHSTSLTSLDVFGCPIIEFPEIPTNLRSLGLRKTRIQEVPSSIGDMNQLEYLDLSGSSNIQDLPSSIVNLDALDLIDLSGCTNITSFPNVPANVMQLDLDCTGIEEVPSWISRLTNLCTLNMRDCKSLKSIAELPPCLRWLVAHGCTSLKNFSPTNQYQCSLYESKTWQSIIFADCFDLSQDAIDNIVANAVFRSQCIARLLAEELTQGYYEPDGYKGQVVCCLPASEISERFEYQSTSSSVMASLGSDRRGRFFAFVICMVVDIKHSHKTLNIECQYQLKTKSGDFHDFKVHWQWQMYDDSSMPLELSKRMLVLFDSDMVQEEKDYEEAVFEFSFKDYYNEVTLDGIKVEKCGVHVFYVDAELSNQHYMVESSGGVHLEIIEDEETNSDAADIIQPNSSVVSLKSSVNSSNIGGSIVEEDANGNCKSCNDEDGCKDDKREKAFGGKWGLNLMVVLGIVSFVFFQRSSFRSKRKSPK